MGDIEITIKTNFKTKIKVRRLLRWIALLIFYSFLSSSNFSKISEHFSPEKITEKVESKTPNKIQEESRGEKNSRIFSALEE